MLKNKYFIIFLLILAVLLAGFLFWQFWQKAEWPPETLPTPSASAPSEKNPQSKTATRYFPYAGNAIDFREDGSQGDFEIELAKKEKTAELKWPEEIKVSRVQVFNLGKLWDLQDHRVVFDLGNRESATSTPFAFLASPYEIGKIPEGFFNFTFYDKNFSEKSPIFVKGIRYSIELYGKDENNFQVSASYTFDF